MFEDRRRGLRCARNSETFFSRWEGGALSEKIPAKCLNESRRGMCILTGTRLAKGDSIRINVPSWGIQRNAHVVWSKEAGEGRFQMGLSLN
jgi:hypothetical protein